MCVGWCSSSCKFILNSHLHALTPGQLRAPKNVNAADIRNKSNTPGRQLCWEKPKPGLQRCFQLSYLIYFGVETSKQLLGRLNDIHQLSARWPGDEAFHCDFVITAASLTKWDEWPCVSRFRRFPSKVRRCGDITGDRTVSFSPRRRGGKTSFSEHQGLINEKWPMIHKLEQYCA